MAFSFGSTAAPAPGAFSFSSSTPAAGQPSLSLGGFGTTPAPSSNASAFGFSANTSAPAPVAFSFNATTAAPVFGATPAAPIFGAPSTPTPGANAFSLGTTTSSPFSFSNNVSNQVGGGYGTSSNSGNSLFGNLTSPQQTLQGMVPPAVTISGSMFYNELSPQMKQAIDNIHQSIMRHKRTMMNLQSMAPRLLLSGNTAPERSKVASQKPQISVDLSLLENQMNRLKSDIDGLLVRAKQQNNIDSNLACQSIMYAKWPVEAVAHRKGVHLTPQIAAFESQEEKKDDNINRAATIDIQIRLRESLDRAMASVDRIEKLPSPFLWEVINDLEKRLRGLEQKCIKLLQQIEQSSRMERDLQFYENPLERVSQIVEAHHQTLWCLTSKLDVVRGDMEALRYRYRIVENGENVLDKAAVEISAKEHKRSQEIQLKIIQVPQFSEPPVTTALNPSSSGASATTTIGSNFPSASASASSFSFGGVGSTPAPAASASAPSFSFNPAPTSASTGSFSFASPALTGGPPTHPASALLGQPAAASTPSFGFGSTTAAAAPAAFGFSSSTSTSTPSAKKKTTRSSSRLKR